ncbi:MAG TPA: DNA translocase FtsK 4TM domain-containing protein, partial [Opitutaceae bacterium]|nr:DNA translocase FtsK 4TM domain-containing protein [Opitutaceae bacterium]
MLSALLMVALVDYLPNQSTFANTHPTTTNLVGLWGANSVWMLYYSIGVSTWLLPVFLLWMLYVSIRNARRLAGTRLIAMLVCVACLSGMLAMWESFRSSDFFPQGLGGWLGSVVYQGGLRDTVGIFGAGLLLATVYLFGLMFIFTKDIGAEFERYFAAFQAWRAARAKERAERELARQKAREEREKQKAAAAKAAVVTAPVGPAANKKTVAPLAKDDPPAKPAVP